MNRVIVFDLDDTLYSEHDYVESGFRAVSEYLLENHSIDDFFSVAWQLFCSGERGSIFNQALLGIGLSDDSDLITALVEVYREHTPNIQLFSDGRWALDYFYKRVPLALISDGYLVTQQKKAEALGLNKFFDEMYFTDQWGRKSWKPSPCAFEKVEEKFNASGEGCVYIADNPTKDFVSPNKMGWLSVCVERKGGEYLSAQAPDGGEPQVVINHLSSLELMDLC